MKNILLATTALVMTAGFASAEVTFSGIAEGGVSRAAPKAAVTAKAGTLAGASTLTANSFVAITDSSAGNTYGKWDYSGTGGALAYTKPTTVTASTANAATGSAPYDGSIEAAAVAVTVAKSAVDAANLLVAAAASRSDQDTAATRLAVAQAVLAAANAAYAQQAGTAASAKGATNDVVAYSGYDFNVGLSGTSDNGITFAAGFDMGAGHLADTTDDLELGEQGAAVTASTVTASMNGYTLSFRKDGLDDLYDNTQAGGDLGLKGSIGSITFNVVTDLEKSTAASAAKYTAAANAAGNVNYTRATFTDAVAAKVRSTSYSVGTTVGGIGLSVTGTDGNDNGLSAMRAKATYTMDALTFGLTSDNRGDSTKSLNATKVSVAYAGEGVSASVSSNDDKDWDASATLSAGANSATFVTNEESEWNAQVASDLGGGASVFGYVDHTDLFMAGVRFKF